MALRPARSVVAREVARTLQEGKGPVHLVGHSTGGLDALGIGERLVGGVRIDLEHAIEANQGPDGVPRGSTDPR